MVLPVAALSLLLLTYGRDELPPPKTSPGHRCPAATPQPHFELKDLLRGSFYYNYGFAKHDTLNRFECIKMRFEKQNNDLYLHISGIKKITGTREQSWHLLKRTNERPGHYEIDFRSTNHTVHEAGAYLYLKKDSNPKGTIMLFIIICTRFPMIDKHSVSAMIGSNKPKLAKKSVGDLLKWLKQESNVPIARNGLTAKNKCKLPKKSLSEKRPNSNPHSHSHPHPHSHSHPHSHPRPHSRPRQS